MTTINMFDDRELVLVDSFTEVDINQPAINVLEWSILPLMKGGIKLTGIILINNKGKDIATTKIVEVAGNQVKTLNNKIYNLTKENKHRGNWEYELRIRRPTEYRMLFDNGVF